MKATSESLQMRRFGTTDLLVVLTLWSLMAVVLGGVLSEVLSDSETPMARAQSEAFALRLAQEIKVEGPSSGGRGPASVAEPRSSQNGELGRDPWGNAYRYMVYNGGVLVWSLGRNGVADSEEAVESLISGRSRNFHFRGDDVGFLKASHNKR